MQDLTYRSATQLLEDIQGRRISCADLLEAFIEKIEQKNPDINAVVVTNFEAARHRTQAADKALKRGDNWGPLHGLPMTIKDCFEVAGMPCTAGRPLLKDYVPEQNADAVQSLVDAGAVVMGKTNVPMGGMDFQSYNDVYGQTNNPWDVSLTPGGSSGGAAAAVAAGMTARNVHRFDTAAEAAEDVDAWLGAGDGVLVKASRGVGAECIAEKITIVASELSET